MGIKFNLIFNDIKIGNLTQLKENFYIEDVLLCYKNKKLIQWLEDRNLSNESEKIEEIDSNLSEFEIIKIITEVLKIESSKIKIIKKNKDSESLTEDNSEILEYQEKIKNLEDELETLKIQIKSKDIFVPVLKSLLTNKIDSYNDLKEKIKDNYTDLKIIRYFVSKIEINYSNDFNQDSNFFEKFQNLPLVIFAVLMNKNLRESFLSNNFFKLQTYIYFSRGGKIFINSLPLEYSFSYITKYIKKINNNEIIEKNESLILLLGEDTKLYSLGYSYTNDYIKYNIIKDFEISYNKKDNNNNIYVYYIKIDKKWE